MWCNRRPSGRGGRSGRSTSTGRSVPGSSGSSRTEPATTDAPGDGAPTSRSASASADAARTVVTPEETAVTDAERQRVVDALNRLEPDDRLVIALRWFEHLSEAEMAEALDVAAGTVKSRLSRAMARLKSALESEGAMHG